MIKNLSIAAGIFLGIVVAGTIFALLRNGKQDYIPKSVKKAFVIHFEDMAKLQPNVAPITGVKIDKKAGTIEAGPGVDKLTISYGGGDLEHPCIGCWVTFELSEPLARDASSQGARISKRGDVLESSVSWQMVCR